MSQIFIYVKFSFLYIRLRTFEKSSVISFQKLHLLIRGNVCSKKINTGKKAGRQRFQKHAKHQDTEKQRVHITNMHQIIERDCERLHERDLNKTVVTVC